MQLKMEQPFDNKKCKETYKKHFAFIDDIFSKVPMPADHVDSDEEEQEEKPNIVHVNENGNEEKKRAKNFEELQSKLNKLKGVKKLDYKQKLLKKKMKSKLNKNAKKKERAMNKNKMKKEPKEDCESMVKTENKDTPIVPKQKPIFNSEGHLVFNKFDFSEIGTKKRATKVETNPKKILEQFKVKKQKIQQLEAAGEQEKVLEIKEKEVWKNALLKASGEKVKDDPELLKRSIKREKLEKQKSAKKWESRLENVQKSIQEKQAKRTENIQKRKSEKKNNKLRKAAKKGRIIPGF